MKNQTNLIEIYKKNESIATLQCNTIIEKELRRYFSIKSANYRFAPLFKAGIWNGDISFMNSDNEIGIGLTEKVEEFAAIGKYEVEYKFKRNNKISVVEFTNFVNSLNLPFELRDYQFDAAYEACCKKNLNIHISTAGGKSLVIYVICRFLELLKLQTLIICPTQQLVEQLYSDFAKYGWKVDDYCYRLYSGQTKIFERKIIIACWQSLYKNTKLFQQFGAFICDEVQTASGKSIQSISKSCINASYRFGFSGTFPDSSNADWFSIVGSFGPIKTFATYKSLQESDYIAQIKIFALQLNYHNDFRQEVFLKGNKDYAKETNLIIGNPNRTEFILKLVQNLNENCMILFTKKEAHGHKIRELLEAKLKNKKLIYIDGTVPIKEREASREIIENNNNIVVLATYATLGAGFSVNNLHHIILASSYKSEIKVLQSIGRGLRLHISKNYMKLYDIVDNCIIKTQEIRFINYALKHFKARTKYYEEQNWKVKKIEYDI